MNFSDYRSNILERLKHKKVIKNFDNYFNAFVSSYFEIIPFIDKSKSILEVGCGSGMLINYLRKEGFKVDGVEIYQEGFSDFKIISDTLNVSNFIKITDINDFFPDKKYDVIFSYNVIEHIDDWEKTLNSLNIFLKKEGVIIFILPNYSFPIELHYMIPIILNKKYTYTILKKYINIIEKNSNMIGRWKTLNFIKTNNIEKFYLKKGYEVKYDKEYLIRLISNLRKYQSIDKSVKKNNNIINIILKILARILYEINFLKFYTKLPLCFQPFVKIIARKKGT